MRHENPAGVQTANHRLQFAHTAQNAKFFQGWRQWQDSPTTVGRGYLSNMLLEVIIAEIFRGRVLLAISDERIAVIIEDLHRVGALRRLLLRRLARKPLRTGDVGVVETAWVLGRDQACSILSWGVGIGIVVLCRRETSGGNDRCRSSRCE